MELPSEHIGSRTLVGLQGNGDREVALVTGGSRGIGAAIAKRLARGRDCRYYLHEGSRRGRRSSRRSNDRVARRSLSRRTRRPPTTAIPRKFEETTLDEFDRVIDVNLRGAFVATQAALKHMNEGGRIILIGSCVGEQMMTPGLVPYAATKGAIKMFAQGLAREVGDRGITVNAIQPGPIDTDLNPASGDWAVPQKALTALNRYGSVDEVAALTAFVASPEGAYITGASLTIDSGTSTAVRTLEETGSAAPTPAIPAERSQRTR